MKLKFFACVIVLCFFTGCSAIRDIEEPSATYHGINYITPWENSVTITGMTDTIHLFRAKLLEREAKLACKSNNFSTRLIHRSTNIIRGTIKMIYDVFCEDIYKQKQVEKQKKEVLNAQKKENENLKRINMTCQKFGFKINTPEISKCIFDIYKLELSKTKNKLNSSGKAKSEVTLNKILEEQKRQNDIENNLKLLQRSLDLLNPANPKLTCKYNSVFKNTTCY